MPSKSLECRFFEQSSGNSPVKDWLRDLPKEVRQQVGSDIQLVQQEWPVGKPLVDGFGDGLYEVRSAHVGNIYRVLFCIVGSSMVMLHGFQKKTQKTPQDDIKLARRRKKLVEE